MIAAIEWSMQPQIVDLGFIELRWYSFMFLLGFILGYAVLNRIFKKEGIPVELLDKLTFYVVIAVIVGARLGHCLFYEPEIYLRHPLRMILPFEGKPGVDFRFTGYQGLASHGGIIGMILALWLYSRKYKRPFLWILDRMAVAGAITGTCIRIGNFFNSEIVGVPTDLPWGVKFINLVPEGTPVERIIPLHPAQLYEALSYLLIFTIMIIIYYKKYPDLKPGLLIGLLFVLVFIARFLIEFVKKDQVDFEAGMALNMGQILSIPFILLGIFMIFWKFKTSEKK